MNVKGQVIATLGAAGMLLALTSTAHAVPAFSRAHKVECTTCHTIYPELNEYGEAFMKNSYVYVGKATKGAKKAAPAPAAPKQIAPPPATDTASAPKIKGEGDAGKLSKLKAGAMMGEPGSGTDATAAVPAPSAAPVAAEPADSQNEGLLLAGIPEQLPISFTGSINYAMGDNKAKSATGGTNVDFAARYLKLHAAGNFRDTVGFFATYYAYLESPPTGTFNTSVTPTNQRTDLNEFFLQWRHMFSTPVNLKIGRFQPKMGLWKTNNKLSVTNNYLPYTYTVGQNSTFKIEQAQDALELNSIISKRVFLAGGIVNRKGQDNKEAYGHLSYKFGASDYLGNEPDIDLNKEESIMDFLTFTVGGYGYVGKNGQNVVTSTPRNNYYRVGLDTEVQYKIFKLRTLLGYGVDDNATPSTSTQINPMTLVRSKAITTEAEVTLLVNLIAAGRFEYLQQEGKFVASNVNSSFSNQYLRRYIATLGYAPIENLKISTEFKYEIGQNELNRIGTLGATFSF